MPTSTATVRSASTVSKKVAVQTAMSAYDCLKTSPISSHSPMFQATTNRIAANTGNGTYAARLAPNNNTPSSVIAWMMPDIGERAPERMLVAVRASAPVAGNPPNMGDTILAMPWANSSVLGL